MKSRMFPFITSTFNPVGGECPHDCVYCWAKAIAKRYGHKKYKGDYRFLTQYQNKKFKAGSFVFVCDMIDLFAENVPRKIILQVLDIIRNNPTSKFLLETKNPKRYFKFDYPANVILGVTIESDINFPDISKAPSQSDRILAMSKLSDSLREANIKLDLFISIEPILGFTPHFIENIKYIAPWAVAVGYDNYNNKLPEPALTETDKFISKLKKFTVVYEKSIRIAWWQKMTLERTW